MIGGIQQLDIRGATVPHRDMAVGVVDLNGVIAPMHIAEVD